MVVMMMNTMELLLMRMMMMILKLKKIIGAAVTVRVVQVNGTQGSRHATTDGQFGMQALHDDGIKAHDHGYGATQIGMSCE